MPLSDSHVTHVCCEGDPTGKQCRYLSVDKKRNFVCLKLSSQKDEIDEKVERELHRVRTTSIYGSGYVTPQGDNCKGYPKLSTIVLGYDVDK